ncbi:hypothetical protein RJ641_020520 [Dillenia turbinata]|uniref:Uncharacterized protein n=1 Tax=Dillenia turbinata TaxID=194707 RepID=A0AAN8UT06_9MAGN
MPGYDYVPDENPDFKNKTLKIEKDAVIHPISDCSASRGHFEFSMRLFLLIPVVLLFIIYRTELHIFKI